MAVIALIAGLLKAFIGAETSYVPICLNGNKCSWVLLVSFG